MTTQLSAFMNRVGEQFTKKFYEIRDIQEWMLEEVYRKRVSYNFWKKKVLFTWVSFNKIPRFKGRLSLFYYRKLDLLFRFFIEKIYPLNEKSLELISNIGDTTGEADIFLEYRYHLSKEEIEVFSNFKAKYNHPESTNRIISYSFNSIIMVFGHLIRDILKNQYQITMLCAEVELSPNGSGENLHFLVVARPQDTPFLKAYLKTMIFHFAEVLPSINKSFLEKLRLQKNLIYKMAIDEYQLARENISTVLFTLQRKCDVLHQCTPLLDILNYICSRVEDSIFQTNDLLKNAIQTKISKDSQTIHDLIDIFHFFNQNASLFSTFQSNNRANQQRQYQLFFFYNQYFCAGGLEFMQSNPAYFYPELVREILQQEGLSERFPNINFSTFSSLLSIGMAIVGNPALDIVFNRIFKKNIYEMNEEFIEAFLFSLNKKLNDILEEKAKNNPNFDFSFENIIHFIAIVLYNFVERVFIGESLESVNQNFRDRLSRYTPDKIALRLLELKIFKDIPISDNIWQDYYLSRNKPFLKKLFQKYYEIPEGYFFSPQRLLKINMIYERKLLDSTPRIEEWIIRVVIKTFYEFQDTIKKMLPQIYTRDDLTNAMMTEFTKGVMDQNILDQIEDIVDEIVDIWN